MTPAGLLTTLHSFNGGGDGQWPVAELVEGKDGYFYGTTSTGGAYGDGTVFRMGINGALTTLVSFASPTQNWATRRAKPLASEPASE